MQNSMVEWYIYINSLHFPSGVQLPLHWIHFNHTYKIMSIWLQAHKVLHCECAMCMMKDLCGSWYAQQQRHGIVRDYCNWIVDLMFMTIKRSTEISRQRNGATAIAQKGSKGNRTESLSIRQTDRKFVWCERWTKRINEWMNEQTSASLPLNG